MFLRNEDGKGSLNQGVTIFITHSSSPQLFWYIELKELEAKAKTICQIEKELISHCHRNNHLNEYKQDQHVIVEFLSWSSPKFIRGVICQSKDEEYLVSALDYGFTIKCSAQNLWLLPKEYQMKCLNIKKGCVASVVPLNGINWSKEAIHDFDKKLEDSSLLTFIAEYSNLGSTVGQLFWKSSTKRTQVNAANYLVEKQYACLDAKSNVLMNLHSISLREDLLNISLAEINKKDKQPRLRVRNIMRLIADKDKTVMENNNQKFDIFLQHRKFIIPQTALKMSKVNGSRSGSYDILKSVKPTDAESSAMNSKFSIEQESAKPMKSLQNKDVSKTNSSLGQGKTSVNVVKSPLPTLGTDLNPKRFTGVALAHSSSTVLPMTDKQSLPFCQNIQNAIKRLPNISAMQLLAWPHLMQKSGNSLLLIDNPNSGRSWCYLPALCSLVMRKMQSSNLKLGPVAIIITDLANIIKLAKDCDILMQAHNTSILKVVNTAAFSQTDVCRALLDSCGILMTTLDTFVNLLEIHNRNELMLFDSNYLELFVCDDYDRLRLSNAKLLNEVLQQSRSILKFPLLRFVLIAQQWHRKVFTKLIKDLAGEALILFGDYLEAAMYGGLTMETVLRRTNDKLTQLAKYLDQHKSKRILIYCKSHQELQYLTKELTKMGHQCIGISEAENQQTHQLLLLTDESSHPEHLVKKNIEVLIHYSMPDSWTKFVFRFHSLIDNIANLLVPIQSPIKVVTHLMLDESNYHELSRLLMFFDSHGIEMDKSIQQVVDSYQQEIEMKRPFCPNLLHSGKCNQKQLCNKRHHFVQSDVESPKGPMEQYGTLVRCYVLKVYDPVHMAVRPIEFKPPGSSKWVPAASSDSHLLMALALSMAMKSKPHLPLKTGDVCAIHQQGQYKRVRIVDVPQGRPVTVQLMDLGTELLQVKPMELLECEEKFQVAPPLAMDVRLSQLQPTGGDTANWTLEATKWVTNSFKGLNELEHMQIFVDFAILDVIYASEIAIIEKCQSVRTSVYKLKLRKELLLKGYAQFQDNIDHIKIDKQQEQNSKPNKLTEFKPNEHLVEPLKNVNETTSETKINCNSRKMNRISLMLAAINKFILRTESPVQLESAIVEENHVEPLKVEPPVMDSTTQFFNTLIGQLNVENSSIKNNSAQELISNIFGILKKPKVKEDLENTLPIPSSEISVEVIADSAPISTDHITSALKCIGIADGAVCPTVKWRQTLSHIDITFEQQVPQYELIHQGNTLTYSVIKAEPPQRCVLNLLGEVKIVSQQQHGYILHVKLAKLSLVCYWPTLLNSLYAQQHSHWLIYDTERAKSPPQRMGDVLWQRYVRRLDETNETTDDDDYQGVHHSSDDHFEAGVERCQSLFADYCKDF